MNHGSSYSECGLFRSHRLVQDPERIPRGPRLARETSLSLIHNQRKGRPPIMRSFVSGCYLQTGAQACVDIIHSPKQEPTSQATGTSSGAGHRAPRSPRSSGSRVFPVQHLKLCHQRDAGHFQLHQLCCSIRSRKTFTPLEPLMLIHQRK